jgi:hypothetical protein
MSIVDDARAVLILADYIAVDAGGKINALGCGWTITAVQQTGVTAPQSLAFMIDLPGKYSGQEFSLAIELHDETAGSCRCPRQLASSRPFGSPS